MSEAGLRGHVQRSGKASSWLLCLLVSVTSVLLT